MPVATPFTLQRPRAPWVPRASTRVSERAKRVRNTHEQTVNTLTEPAGGIRIQRGLRLENATITTG
jgi:hypothetical protein